MILKIVWNTSESMANPKHDLDTPEGRAAYFRDTYDLAGFTEACRNAFEKNPDDQAGAKQYAAALEYDSADDRALSGLQDLCARFSTNLDIRFALGLALLKRGRYREAWPYYGDRFGRNRVANRDDALSPETRWRGGSLTGRSILLFPEQGLGDTLQFVRHAINLRDLGARVYINAQPPLRRLLQGSPALGDGVLVQGVSVNLHAWSYMLDLVPAFLGTYEDVSWPGSYIGLPARRDPVALPKHDDGRIRVGLAWQGSGLMATNYLRSIPLKRLSPLREVDNCRFCSLMPPSATDDIAAAGADVWLTDLSEISSPFEELARIVDAMDVVVTVCTSIAHLAGAMGKPVIILLNAAADWRWGLGGRETRWYPSATLIRQDRLGDWSGPVAEAQRILSEL